MNADPQRKRDLGAIHAARKMLALDDGTYRALLARVTGLASSAAMDAAQRRAVLEEFRRLGFKRLPARRPIGASPLASKARALWLSLHALGELADAGDGAFIAFVHRQTHVERPEWLTPRQWNAVIEALKSWCARAGFAQPLPEEVVAFDASRERAGMAPGGAGFAARVKLIEALWAKLIALGAMRTGAHARLDTWLLKRFAAREPYWLAPDAADAAIAQLGRWVRETKGKAGARHGDTEAPSTRGRTPAAQGEERGDPDGR